MGLSILGLIVLIGLVAAGFYWVSTNVYIKGDDE